MIRMGLTAEHTCDNRLPITRIITAMIHDKPKDGGHPELRVIDD